MDVPAGHITPSAPSYLRAHSIVLISSHSRLSWRHTVTYGSEPGTQSTSPFYPSRGQPTTRPPPRQLPTAGRTHLFVQHTYTCLRSLPDGDTSHPKSKSTTTGTLIQRKNNDQLSLQLNPQGLHLLCRSSVTSRQTGSIPIILKTPMTGTIL